MLAKRPTALAVFVAAVIMFALILAFFLWAAASEARSIDLPITTNFPTDLPAPLTTQSPTP